ncbi:hypothetical protein P5V15_009916 [Pogonomyrmex californicus]
MAEKLREAAAHGDVDRVVRLLNENVKLLPDEHGNSALHEASWRGYSRTVAILAKALGTQRTSLHARNFAGFAPLHLACQNGHNQTCRELLLAGSNPDLQNNYGDTPLHTSARYGHAGVMRILISALCKVSDQNKNGDTALHIAAAMGRRKLTRILLEAGCDRNLRNKQNETAKDIARRKNHIEILEIISRARGKSRTRSKSREGGSVDGKIDDNKAMRSDKKREKSGSGTSGGGGSNSKKDRKKYKANSKQHKVRFERAIMGRQWSPYGCHYYPDPESFPQPRLDSLPADPLGRGEQYYLDLAGNIRKGPVGVGYTCYCAPFFRHMEAKLERDKAELKAHIDQAHEKLDLKVANLERRTRGQISQLTKCVQEEHSRCNEKYSHLQQHLQRGGRGRYSERLVKTNYNQSEVISPIRTRSLEDLLDDRPQDRSFEIPGETPIHRGSLDDLDIPAIPRLSISMKELPSQSRITKSELRVLDISPKLNETFHGVIKQSGNSSPDIVAIESAPMNERQQRSCVSHDMLSMNMCMDESKIQKINHGNMIEWNGSVQEMIKQFQQVPDIHNSWRRSHSESDEQASLEERIKCSQNRRVHTQDSDNSEKDDEIEQSKTYKEMNCKKDISKDMSYDIAQMPYRSRKSVYSPTSLLHDTHNDSGYSTRMYGSSKGASPSLSGQLECDVILSPSIGSFTSGGQLTALLKQPRKHNLTIYERNTDNVVINIGTASLV